MGSPLVSIIVPAYNAGSVISETLGSIQAQTHSHFETIVVDDGSRDETAERVREFAQKDDRFKLVRQKNEGVSAARNAALRQAKGEWIAFVDADDVWLPQKLERQLKALSADPQLNLSFTNYFIWDGAKDVGVRYSPEKFPRKNISTTLVQVNLFGLSSVVVRRDLVNSVGLFDSELNPAEDWDFWLRMAEKGLHCHGIDEPLWRYRVWPGNASRNSILMAEKNVKVLEKAIARCQDAGMKRLYQRSLRVARGNLHLARTRPLLEKTPEVVPAAAWRSWLECPTRVKWLLWFLGTSWPQVLGGGCFAKAVHRKICKKWP